MEVLASILPVLAVFAILAFIFLRPRSAQVLAARIVSPTRNICHVSAPMSEVASIAIPKSTPGAISLSKGGALSLSVHLTGASLRVKREGNGDNIIVKANFPQDWSVDNGTIRQVNTAGPHLLVAGQSFTITQVLREEKAVDPSRITVENGSVMIDGLPVEPMFATDTLEVIVPESFRGDLEVVNEDNEEVTIDSWRGGKLSLDSRSNGDFTGGDLSELESFTLLVSGSGNTTFGAVDARTAKITLDNGNLELTSLKGGTHEVAVNGSGDINCPVIAVDSGELKLDSDSNCNVTVRELTASRSFKIESFGSGDLDITTISGGDYNLRFGPSSNLTVSTIDVESWDFETEGSGDFSADKLAVRSKLALRLEDDSNCNVTVGTVEAEEATIRSFGSGDLELTTVKGGAYTLNFGPSSNLTTTTIDVASWLFSTEGSGDFSADSLKARRQLTLALSEDSNCNVTVSSIDSDEATVESLGTGDVQIDTISGVNFSARFGSNSNFTLDNNAELSGKLKLEMEGTGDASMGSLNVDEAEFATTDNANITASWLKARSALVQHDGSATVSIEDGEVSSIELNSTDSGDINAHGRFASVRTDNRGSGSISL